MTMKRLVLASCLVIALSLPAFAQDLAKPDDSVNLSLAAEDWVTTKTARVVLNVDAAVSAASAGTMRAEMTKNVAATVKGDWKLTGFSRNQDKSGLEHWAATYEARLPESDLNGLAEAAKKVSKPGLQITVGDMDFSPTLEETQAALATLRTRIYKSAADQLKMLNEALPGRNYRIAQITFDSAPQPMAAMARPMMKLARMAANEDAVAAPDMQRSEKLVVNASVVFAAPAPAPAAAQPPSASH